MTLATRNKILFRCTPSPSCVLAAIMAMLALVSQAAGVHIVGYVRDADTREPIPMVSIALMGTTLGEMSDVNGGFAIDTDVDVAVLRFTAVGYQAQDVTINPGQTVLVVDMTPGTISLDEVVVKRTREKYSKKNNPAVDLITRVRKSMHDHDPMESDYYSFDKYQRLVYGFNDFDELADRNKAFRRFGFLGDYADTSALTGKRVLPISIKEEVSTEYFRHSPRTHKEVVIGQRSGGIDESLDQASVKRYLEDVFREVDIYRNDITLLSNRFVSPLSVIGPDFYKYYLSDTLDVDGVTCIELSFAPHTPETFGFLGRLYLPLADSTLFIKKVVLNVPHRINLNYVDRVAIVQEYDQGPYGTRFKTRDDIEVEFRIMSGTPGLFARRETAYTGHSLQPPADMAVFSLKGEQTIAPNAEQMPDQFWAESRPSTMHTDETAIKQMLERLRQSKWFYWSEKVIVALVKGYIPTGNPSKWDFGPVNTVVNANELEGLRLRLGGMTTVGLSRHWFLRTYAAYGFDDRRWKYMGQVEYSFDPKKELDQEFPIHSLRLKHCYDVDKLGQHYLYTNTDNVFLLLKRAKDDKMDYLRRTELEWKREWLNHFSVAVALEHNVHEASRLLPYELPGGERIKRYTQAGFTATLRFAPGEKFYQSRSYRIPINMDAPIVTLTHTWHPKGWMGTRYELNKTELGLQKRFWFSAFGYTDVIVKGAKVWNRAAYPDLLIPNANLSYTIQPESFALMDAMEFVADRTLSWDVTYWANGALLNRLPLIKYLKLREVFTFRGIWGGIDDRSNPAIDQDVFLFPTGTLCQSLSHKPYLEIGVGLDNILTFLRLDYTWRLSYRDTPGVSRAGLRLALHFNF